MKPEVLVEFCCRTVSACIKNVDERVKVPVWGSAIINLNVRNVADSFSPAAGSVRVFFPVSAFPLIFQSFNYRSAVEQTSSAQYRLSFCSQTAGWISVLKTVIWNTQCVSKQLHILFILREKHLPQTTDCWSPTVTFLELNCSCTVFSVTFAFKPNLKG